jgi:hypothetical protein
MTENSKSNPFELDDVDSSWDDEESGEIALDSAALQVPDLERAASERPTAIPDLPPDEYVRQAMGAASAAEDEAEQKSGVQAKESHPPIAGLELDLPPLVTPAPTPSSGMDLTMDEPDGRPSFDDLSLELGSDGALDPMQASAPVGELELDLETPVAPPAGDPTVTDLRDRYAAGDFTGALTLAEAVLEQDPDHTDAKRYAQSCRDVLIQMYSARLGPLDQVAAVAIPADQVRWLSLDHRSGFLLSLVDGTSTVEEILDISGMVRLDALRIMYTLLEQQIISLSGGST